MIQPAAMQQSPHAVDEREDVVSELNQIARATLHCGKQIEIIPGATHLFEEPSMREALTSLTWVRCNHHLTDQRFVSGKLF